MIEHQTKTNATNELASQRVETVLYSVICYLTKISHLLFPGINIQSLYLFVNESQRLLPNQSVPNQQTYWRLAIATKYNCYLAYNY